MISAVQHYMDVAWLEPASLPRSFSKSSLRPMWADCTMINLQKSRKRNNLTDSSET